MGVIVGVGVGVGCGVAGGCCACGGFGDGSAVGGLSPPLSSVGMSRSGVGVGCVFLTIGLGVTDGDTCGVGLVVALSGLKMFSGSKSGAIGCFCGTALGGLGVGCLKIVPSEGRCGEKGIVWGAVEKLVLEGVAAGRVGAVGLAAGKTCGVGTCGA